MKVATVNALLIVRAALKNLGAPSSLVLEGIWLASSNSRMEKLPLAAIRKPLLLYLAGEESSWPAEAVSDGAASSSDSVSIGGQTGADLFKSLRESAKSAFGALFADFFRRFADFLQTFFDVLQTFCRLYLIDKPLSCRLFADFLSK